MVQPVRIAQWAGFGAIVGAITSLFLALLVGLIVALFGANVLGLSFTLWALVLVALPIAILIGAIIGAISWTIAGIVYDLFLHRALSGFSVYWQMFGLQFIIGFVSSIFSLSATNLIALVVSTLIGTTIVYVIVSLLRIPTPFD